MFGFFIGTVCLVLLFSHLRRRHYYAAYGPWSDDDGYGYGGWGRSFGYGYGGGFGMRRGFFGQRRGRHFRRYIARKLLTRLDTTPGQEKAIRTAVETVRNSMSSGREELQSVRRDLAQAFGAEALDEEALQAAISKQEAFVNRSRTEIVQAIRNVHDALDPRQRRQVSEWISSGFLHRDHRERDRDDDWM